jgi:hypothetical protein
MSSPRWLGNSKGGGKNKCVSTGGSFQKLLGNFKDPHEKLVSGNSKGGSKILKFEGPRPPCMD